MPETGLVAPARTFVAVRAIVPVTQMPPKSAEQIFATPWAISSMLERCLRPVIPSATTADSKDSIAPRRANETASGKTAAALSSESGGKVGRRSPRGMPPNRVPIVSAGNCRRATKAEAAATAISMPGQCGRNRRSPRMMPIVSAAVSTAAQLTVPAAWPSAMSLSTIGPGSAPESVRPKRSRNWLAKMITAIPAVKPTVTG